MQTHFGTDVPFEVFFARCLGGFGASERFEAGDKALFVLCGVLAVVVTFGWRFFFSFAVSVASLPAFVAFAGPALDAFHMSPRDWSLG